MNRLLTYKLPFTLLITVLLCNALSAQNLKLDLASNMMDKFDYAMASEIYEDVLERHPSNYDAIKQAAICYTKLRNSEKAEQLYKQLYSLKLATSEDLLLLADALKQNKKYDEALDIYKKHSILFPGNERVRRYLKNENWAYKINRDSSLFELKNSSINSKYSDFAPCFFNNTVIFSSARGEGRGSNNKYSWNQQSYLNLYKAELTLDSNLIRPVVFDDNVNSRFHEGTATYNTIERSLYITRNNFIKGTKKKDQEGYLNLAVYKTRDFNGEFEDLVPFDFNSPEYSVGHPSISGDGKTLYFTSDMPKGYGGTDLYKSEWEGSKWGEPKNLGSKINTSGNEMFPFIFGSTLYFSSDGHIGLGGLDIHQVDITNEESEVVNSGYPLNTSFDDFSVIFSPDGKSGFLASNRSGGVGDDDIYKFFISTPKFITINGTVRNEETGYPVAGTSIYLKDEFEPSKIDIIATTDENGRYEFTIPYQDVYDLVASKKGFFETNKRIASSPTTSFIDKVDFKLKKYDFLAEGHVLYAEDNSPMSGALLTLTDETGAIIAEKYTGANGYYSFGLYKDKQFKITCTNGDYALQSVSYDTRNRKTTIFEHDFKMFKTEVGTTVTLDNIYYDYNEWDIRSDAARELDKLVVILKDNPEINIELGSHSDSRGKDQYNLTLSSKRAKSAVDYIISQGISPSRITSKGYGEKRIKNHCKNGIRCSDSEHEVNRRTEFMIVD